ncbi:hypothetical protein B842_03960 [Corynebacterium humireducens NBRC 106098 = DSM 45392]|uniref:Uncharacterized protein n=1 Tax=Corynebacterium humireducens NBRC 106098 = DSM 45392 TaxID=1223515 RepID=A0A0B5D1C0_9CORY|nr:hypothetical protein B842_03960 [Corynebacterium humireducens NBRC 106098 = DSM 45392]
MRLTLSIDLDAVSDDPTAEVGRILRYWAGAVGQMDLTEEAEHPLMNSTYTAEVGRIRLHRG